MKRRYWVEYGFGGVCAFLCLVTMALNWTSPVARTLLKGERVGGLVIGSDYSDYARHSDTLMYVSYDPTSRFLDVLSIPRDTHVQIPDLPFVHRVNEIFAYEFRHSGRNFTIASLAFKDYVEKLLSTGASQALRIPFFFAIDYRSFATLIDAMGGVYVKVTEPMDYDDNWGKLHIHFKPGTYLMEGKTALLYVRFRGATADQGRVLRQQIFIKDVLKRLKNPVVLWRLPKYTKLLLQGIHTNFTFWDMVSLFLEGRRMQWTNLRLFAVPGAPAGNLWKMNPVMTQHIVSMMQKPVTASPAVPAERTRAALEKRGAATVEVWNASTAPSLTRAVVRYLRNKGFDVVVHGNFATRQQRTLVIDRSGQLRPAQAVAESLRGINPEVVSRVDLTRHVDVSVILGNDAAAKDGTRWRWQ